MFSQTYCRGQGGQELANSPAEGTSILSGDMYIVYPFRETTRAVRGIV